MKNYFNNEIKLLEYLDTHDLFDRYAETIDVLFDEQMRNLSIAHGNVTIHPDFSHPDHKNYYELTVSGYNMLSNSKNSRINKKIGIITLFVSIISVLIAAATFILQFFNH